MLAWLNDIPFYILEAPEWAGSWSVVRHEYVTDHKPKTIRISKNVENILVHGILFGKAAALKKDLLLKALQKDSCELRHPVFGGTKVLVPIRYAIKPYEGSQQGYSFEMEFLEKGEANKTSLFDDVNQAVSQIEGLVTLCAEELFRNITFFADLDFLCERVKTLCSNAEGLIFEEIFLPHKIINKTLDTAREIVKKIFDLPVTLCEKIFHAVGYTAGLSLSFFVASVRPDVLGVLPKGAKGKLNVFLQENPSAKDHHIFLKLWDLSILPEEKEGRLERKNRPSLVAAHEMGDLEKERFLSEHFGSPFRV